MKLTQILRHLYLSTMFTVPASDDDACAELVTVRVAQILEHCGCCLYQRLFTHLDSEGDIHIHGKCLGYVYFKKYKTDRGSIIYRLHIEDSLYLFKRELLAFTLYLTWRSFKYSMPFPVFQLSLVDL